MIMTKEVPTKTLEKCLAIKIIIVNICTYNYTLEIPCFHHKSLVILTPNVTFKYRKKYY